MINAINFKSKINGIQYSVVLLGILQGLIPQNSRVVRQNGSMGDLYPISSAEKYNFCDFHLQVLPKFDWRKMYGVLHALFGGFIILAITVSTSLWLLYKYNILCRQKQILRLPSSGSTRNLIDQRCMEFCTHFSGDSLSLLLRLVHLPLLIN